MLDKFIAFLFSMRLMAILILLFFVAIGYATFIENDFGTQTAKALIYNTTWFELIIVLLSVNMIAISIDTNFGAKKNGQCYFSTFRL